MAIDRIGSLDAYQQIASLRESAKAASGNAPAGAKFANALEQALDKVSELQNQSSTMQRAFQLGDERVTLEETMLAGQKAQLGFQAVLQVRNRVVAAYQEIMNMQV